MMEWRTMNEDDLPAVLAVSVDVHPQFPEGEAMFRNRLTLYPAGCLVLADGAEICGYAIAHPAARFAPPPLDHLMDALPMDADDFYIHDVALLSRARGGGNARAGIERLLAQARAFETVSLVSVNDTGPFWGRFGFRPVTREDVAAKLRPYGPGAIYMQRERE